MTIFRCYCGRTQWPHAPGCVFAGLDNFYDDQKERAMPMAKTEVRERAKLRLNEENRAKRAFDTIYELAEKHLDDARLAELHGIKALLIHTIRNQHLLEPIREARGKADYSKGDF